MDIKWEGEGLNERGVFNNKEIIKVDKNYFRPTEVDELIGDSSKAKTKLGWKPKISFEEMIEEMIIFDLNKEKILINS